MTHKDTVYNFKGLKAIVTGGSRGIGLSIVDGLAQANMDKIYVLGRTQADLDAVQKKFRCVEAVCIDLSDWSAARTVLETIEPVDFLINNAGTSILGSFLDTPKEDIDQVFSLNIMSVINVSQVVCKRMKERGHGCVVNVSSQASTKPLQDHLAYCASKAALDAITRQMALELAPEIRVNSVNPTVVLTEMGRQVWTGPHGDAFKAKIPMGKFAEVDDVTSAVLFLLSSSSAMIHGHCLSVDGGLLAM